MLVYQRVRFVVAFLSVKSSNPHVRHSEIQREQDLKNADVVRPKDLEERYTSGDLTSYW